MSEERCRRDVRAAALTRPAIEQARGVLMAHRRASPDQAFAELVHALQNSNLKLALLAPPVVHVAAGCSHMVDAEVRDVVVMHWQWLSDRLVPARLPLLPPRAAARVDMPASVSAR